MAIPLARRYIIEVPTATDDVAQQHLIADPSVSQFEEPYYRAIHNSSDVDFQPQQLNLTAAAPSTAMDNAEPLIKADENWLNTHWRPAMAYLYMLTCFFDFIVFPVLWSLLQAYFKGALTSQWQPLTLQGGGLYHIAMGTILGVAAYGRTKEKLANLA